MRRWNSMSEVERVGLYTRQSLYGLLWVIQASLLLRAVSDLSDGRDLVLVAAIGVVTSVAATPVLARVMADHPDSWRVPWDVAWPLLVLALAGAAVLAPLDRTARVIGAIMIVVAVAAALSGLRARRESAALVVVLTVFTTLLSWSWIAGLLALGIVLFFVFTVRVSLWVLDVVGQLDRSRAVGARLAVAEERLRFSRDLHDVMGRRLSTIAVQSELAATLADRGDPRAAPQMIEVQGVAHEALREARELARGYRPTGLDQELDGARSLLRSAGIGVDVAVHDVPAAWHEPAGWVIREAVTNVLRHSAASRVRLGWDDDVLEIENDGAAPAPAAADGAGLLGLRERLGAYGARLETEHDGSRFALRARFPGEDPG